MSDNRGDAAGYLGWFLLGSLVGAGIALILAPRPGEETRELLRKKGTEWARRAQEMATDVQDRAGEFVEKGRERFEQQAERLTAAFEAGREAMKEEISRGRPAG